MRKITAKAGSQRVCFFAAIDATATRSPSHTIIINAGPAEPVLPANMQSGSEGINPLRPYYVPPSIGAPSDPGPVSPAAPLHSTSGRSTFTLPVIDYADYLPEDTPTFSASIQNLLNEALQRYGRVLVAQPFEVAKLILQVHVAQDEQADGSPGRAAAPEHTAYRWGLHHGEGELSDDEPNFFTSAVNFEHASRSPPPRGRAGRPPLQPGLSEQSPRAAGAPSSSPYRIKIKNTHSLRDAISALSANSGVLALWRATNTTFIYNILQRTLETFFQSFLAAIFGISDADVFVPAPSGALPSSTILASSAPLAAVVIATASSTIASLLLGPIDAARTRMILTPSLHEPRTLLGTLRTLTPAWLIPSHLVPITFLSSSVPALISTSTPLFLKSYLNLDPVLTPNSWSVLTFIGSALDLAVKLPLETVLRRAQIATWTAAASSPPSSSSKRKAIETIVPVPQSYRGVVPTMWTIMRDEGYSESQKDRLAADAGRAPRRKRKGQGIAGLYRGWRFGLWGLVGVWGAGFIGGLQGSGESPTETPATHGGKF